jgi:predicted histone-like DNA-binding protein
MSILFNKIQRGNPGNPEAPKKWYPSLKMLKCIGEKEVAKLIADETTLNRKEAEMAIHQLLKVMINSLLASNSVQLGDWGSFYLSCRGEGCDTKEEVTATKIKSLNIRFVPGKELKHAMKNASFIQAESVVSSSK